MSAPILGALGIFALLVLLMFRIPVWAALALVGLVGNWILSGWQSAITFAGLTPFDVSSSYGLSVLPLFILMGEVASGSRLSSDLFQASRVILSGIRGGLPIAVIGASACFGAVCGSSIATAATITRIALPEMKKAGYQDGFATGSIAAGGSLGILIPPSIILVIYAAISEQSVPKLFAASLFPGIILTLLYIGVAYLVAVYRPEYSPNAPGVSFRERLVAMRGPWQFVLLFTVSIGGIYAGIFSPTEAASIGAFGAILLGWFGKRLTWKILISSIENSVITSCMLFAIIIGANLFSYFMVQTQLPSLLADLALELNMPGLLVLTIIVAIYIVLGCVLEGIGMILITVPVFLPLMMKFGYDPIWFGIIVVIVVEVGLMNPPVGMNLFVIQAQAPDVKIADIYWGVVPFLFAPVVLIILLVMVPELVLWFPALLYGK